MPTKRDDLYLLSSHLDLDRRISITMSKVEFMELISFHHRKEILSHFRLLSSLLFNIKTLSSFSSKKIHFYGYQ